ncbi:bifunctional protein-disulfide isomerase/oxidoreductase DsbC [Catenovulum sediminis]|uniref:Thiol:disulfide interchange protein n=1 Tax=Catenovulum sediminis TaxID=1740262 RepID=A0ABV1RL21_9ALTE|nr:bifunctional protein-disulfide isomerase/oxidoreductase DsbC [Catenovulum sediminis]
MLNKTFKRACIALLALGIQMPSLVSAEADTKAIKNSVENRLGLKVEDIIDIPVQGMSGVLTDKGLFYVSDNGEYLFHGSLFNVKQNMRNESEVILSGVRQQQLNQFSGDMITYKAKNEKHVINVFTDITCGYCRKLHQQIDEYNALGITVKYLAFPRGGVASQSYNDMVSVWCANDPKQAMTDAKLQGKVVAKSCENNVEAQYNFGAQSGVTGTPAIILKDGTLVPGYRPPADMLKVLEG